MKSFHISQVLVLLASAALILPACNGGGTDTPTESGDQAVSSAEVAEAPGASELGPKAKFAKMFAQADKDSDGQVTESEVRAAATAKFAEADKNQDGYLERDELMALGKAHWAGKRSAGMRGGKAAPGERGMKRFQMADADGDGKISKSEAPERMAAHFDRIDADGDGFVTQDEARSMIGKGGKGGPGRGSGPMAMLDADGDGKISSVEFVNGHIERMKKADTNGDGAATLEEISSAAKKMRGHFGPGRMGQRGMGHRFEGKGAMRGERAAKRFAALDANKDGKITKAEADAARSARFAAIDTDHNGVLEGTELTAHQQSQRGKRAAERFTSLDADGNGTLSLSEVPPFMAERFQKVDADGNGAITVQEMNAARQEHKAGPRAQRGQFAHRMDADNDGKITAAEFAQKRAGWFEHADSNADGVVTLEELQAGKHGKPGRGMKR